MNLDHMWRAVRAPVKVYIVTAGSGMMGDDGGGSSRPVFANFISHVCFRC